MNNTQTLLKKAEQGFQKLDVGNDYKTSAIKFLKKWLENAKFSDYKPQIKHLIKTEQWDYLLDCFYQVKPFGTGGKRGEVGIGPNRLNDYAIRSSAQGHAQYLLKHHRHQAFKRGIAIAYDVRAFTGNKFFNPDLPNPVLNLSCKDMAKSAAEVYAANGIKVFFFESFRPTPELSFTIRHLKAVSGCMISASHNPPDHNGIKIFDEHGGQLIPPYDEQLVAEVTEKVKEIKQIDFNQAKKQNLINIIGKKIDEAYWQTVANLALSDTRDINIVYTPLHGTGSKSVYSVLKKLGFNIVMDPMTKDADPNFSNVTFNIPNPEVEQSYITSLKYCRKVGADILLSSDPDADRVGIMVMHDDDYQFINGQEISAILAHYSINKMSPEFQGHGTIIKTQVTTGLIKQICDKNQVNLIGDLLVGFKYVGEVMNQLEAEDKLDEFYLACEESHGYLSGSYARDKDGALAAMWLAELCAELKQEGRTLIDYLNSIYSEFGYYRNYLTEIRLPGAEGRSKILSILEQIRSTQPKKFGNFEVKQMEDWRDRKPIVSETDFQAKNGLVLYLKPVEDIKTLKLTIRPSGTEPKVKMYFELGSAPFKPEKREVVKNELEKTLKQLEKDFMQYCYQLIGIDFPDRGFLLFWQIPAQDKMHYFDIEQKIADLKNIAQDQRRSKLNQLLDFLGSDPVEKVDDAFKAKYGKSIEQYLELA